MRRSIVQIGENEFQVVTKSCSGRARKFLRCTHIALSGPYQGQQCLFERRNDSAYFKEFNGTHNNIYSIKGFFDQHGTMSCEKEEIDAKFYQFIASSNISLRKAVSKETISFINSCIQYGFHLGKTKIENIRQFPKRFIQI